MVRRRIRQLEPQNGTGLQLRVGTPQDQLFVRTLSQQAFAQFGDYASFLPNYLQHTAVLTTIGEEEQRPIGFVMLAFVLSDKPLPDFFTAEESRSSSLPDHAPPRWIDAEILAIAVSPSAQGKGVGHQLLHHALTIARTWHENTDVRSVQLNVAQTNEKAFTFFCKRGFQTLDPDDGTYPKGQRSIRMIYLCR